MLLFQYHFWDHLAQLGWWDTSVNNLWFIISLHQLEIIMMVKLLLKGTTEPGMPNQPKLWGGSFSIFFWKWLHQNIKCACEILG